MKRFVRITLLVLFVALTTACLADQIAIQSVTPSSTWNTYDVQNLINGAGLVGDLHDNNWQNMWITDNTPTGWLIFDLGDVYALDHASVWNYNGVCCGLDRSVKNMDVLLSTDGINYGYFGSFVLTEGTGDWIPPDTLSLMGGSARYIEFVLNTTYGANDYIGLSEAVLRGTGVPEPSSIILMLTGCSSLIPLARRLLRR